MRLLKDASRRYYVIRKNPHCFRAIDLPESMGAYLASRSKKVRSEIVRKHRKLSRTLPDIALCVHEAPMNVDAVFSKVRDVEQDSWKLKANTAIVSSEQEERYYRSLLELNERDVQGVGFFLEIDEEPLAFAIGVAHQKRLYVLKTSYKSRYASLSPGQVLFYRLIEHCSEYKKETKTIELLGTDTRWIRELSSTKRPLCDVVLLRKSFKTALIMLYHKQVRPVAKQMMEKHPRLSALRDGLARPGKRYTE